jgi:hypothetical protein
MDWIHLVQGRDQWRPLVNMVMNFWAPQNIRKFLSGLATGDFSWRARLRRVSLLVNLNG